jgi:hypothetical protein
VSTVHIAGLAVLMGRHGRQRCAWCGEILFEVDENTASPAGTPPSRPWRERSLIEVTRDSRCITSVAIPDTWGDDMPPNACIGPPKLRLV